MGFIEFIILCFVVVAIAWGGVWLLSNIEHPPIIDKLIWGIAILIILIALAKATGIMSHDPQIPKIG